MSALYHKLIIKTERERARERGEEEEPGLLKHCFGFEQTAGGVAPVLQAGNTPSLMTGLCSLSNSPVIVCRDASGWAEWLSALTGVIDGRVFHP